MGAKKTLYTFSAEEISLLRRVIEQQRNSRVNTESRPGTDSSWSDGQDYLAPEVYLATPKSGESIPAVSGGVVSSRECSISQIVYDDAAKALIIEALPGTPIDVFNPTNAATDKPFLALREKFGNWVVASGGGGTAGTVVRVSKIPLKGRQAYEGDVRTPVIRGAPFNDVVFLALQNPKTVEFYNLLEAAAGTPFLRVGNEVLVFDLSGIDSKGKSGTIKVCSQFPTGFLY